MDNNVNVEQILESMSLKQKIEQLTQVLFRKKNYEALKERISKESIGSIIAGLDIGIGGPECLKMINELQRISVEKHGIPILYSRDVIYGHRIIYPIPLAMSSAFYPELVQKCYECIGEEAVNDGLRWSFSPMLDVSRDPRWGRIIEGPGEDPYLGEKYAEAAVKGFQGTGETAKVAACAKHYVGYGASEGGRDYHRTEISDYNLRNYYLRAFRAAVKSDCLTVMSSFNEISGQPATSSKYLLTDVLKEEFEFKGFVVSDFGAVEQLVRQGVAQDRQEAACLAINAGLDMDMADGCYHEELEKAVTDGRVPMETIDEAVRRVLRVKVKLGLFEKPYVTPKPVDMEVHRRLAREMASESIVLLKNENKALPLSGNEKLIVVGDMAHDKRSILGGWVLDFDLNESVSVMEGIRAACETAQYYDYSDGNHRMMSEGDAVIVVIGESHVITGEASTVADIELTDAQKEMIYQARKMNRKVIGVMCFGRPRALQSVEDMFDAIVWAWHGGSQLGNAVADILFGKVSPSGRLAVTLPRVNGQIPIFYNCPPSGRDVDGYYGVETLYKNYYDVEGTPLYPFGYGLSYAEFSYSVPVTDRREVSLEALKSGEKFQISVSVKNVCDVASKEVVQCYIRDCYSSMTRPIRELKGFEKSMFQPGEEKTITFSLGYEELGFYGANGKYVVEPGEFCVYVGQNCLCKEYVSIKVV